MKNTDVASAKLSSAAAAERHADRLRGDLAGTLEQIADNLAPARLAAEAMAATREQAPDWLKRYWRLARSPAGLAMVGGVAALALTGAFTARRRPQRFRD